MSLSLQMDLTRYRADMNRFITELNADGVQLLKEEMRLLLRDVVRFTPPKTYAQGRKAIEGDLRRVARPLDPAKIQMPALQKAIARRDVAAIEAITKNLGGGWRGRTLLRSLAAIKEAHLRLRNRYGRVRGDGRQMAFFNDWRKYLRTVQDRSGWTRAGWWRAADGVGLSLPSWVNKHRAYAPGGFLAPGDKNLSITAINRSVKIPDYENRHVVPAIRARARSLASELARLVAGGKSRRGSLSATSSGQAQIS